MNKTSHNKPPLSATKARLTDHVAQECTPSDPRGAPAPTKTFTPYKHTTIPAPTRHSPIERAPSIIGGRAYNPQD